jgi:hypothetical protein
VTKSSSGPDRYCTGERCGGREEDFNGRSQMMSGNECMIVVACMPEL